MSGRVRIGILGFGLHGVRRLVPAFRNCVHAEFAGLWRRDGEAAQKNCSDYGVPLCFRSREELCSSPDIDVVFVTSPDAMHCDDVLLALRSGKAVLCEKPLAMTGSQALEIHAAARDAGLLLGVAQNYRYNRSLEWLREQVQGGAIGKPQMAHVQFSSPAYLSPRRWIADASIACGGPIGDVGVHCIDALRFVLNEEVLSVSTLAQQDELSGAVESRAALQLEMTGDVFANVMVSARGKYRTLIEVTGTEGVVIAENGLTVDKPIEMMLRRGGELVEKVTVENLDGYTRMLDGFALAYRGEGSYVATGEDGVKNMLALDAAFSSWRSGKRERVASADGDTPIDRNGSTGQWRPKLWSLSCESSRGSDAVLRQAEDISYRR